MWTTLVFLCVLTCTAAPSQAQRRAAESQKEIVKGPPSRELYAGDAACRSCHEKVSITYEQTAHHLTSRPATRDSIAGSFAEGLNTLQTANPALVFHMDSDATGFHQTAVDTISPGKKVELTEPMDITVGSGRKAQTYLYWKGDELFELPVSYWVKTNAWINSPGYADGSVRFDRPIYPRCLECHGSSFQSLAPPANHFEKASVVLGIECERCHGPALAHVSYYKDHANPVVAETSPRKAAVGIVNPALLSRPRQLDGCALCHAGLGKPLAPALSYQPGAALDRYLQIPPSDPTASVDVHGNQVELLERSRCFQKSAMTCSTCHNVHQVQRDPAAFSATCLQCHQARQCGRFHTLGEAILPRCVECHMPLRKSSMLFSDTNDQTLQLPVRDHRIAIYPDAVAEQAQR